MQSKLSLLLGPLGVILCGGVFSGTAAPEGSGPHAVNPVPSSEAEPGRGSDDGLVGYWKLRGDCRDYSGHGNHGVNHGVDLDRSTFDGISAYIEVPGSETLKLGKGDFTFCARIFTEKIWTMSSGMCWICTILACDEASRFP